MTDKQLPIPSGGQTQPKSFEQIMRFNPHGAEYWSARDLQEMLGYNHWRNFEKAIDKAITSCGQSGNDPLHHFARARKPIRGAQPLGCGLFSGQDWTDSHHFAGAGKMVLRIALRAALDCPCHLHC
jgi:DNA-damage-inducible protein D